MRVIALLFFLLTAPFVIFLATISYGEISPEIIKEELGKSGIYRKIEFPPITPQYVKGKVEKAVDDSALWITGRTETPPIVSFKDIKDEFLASNPDIQGSLEEMAEMPQEEYGEYGTNEDPQELMRSLSKNDFSYSLKDSLSSLRMGHTIISILLPVLAILMVVSIVLIIVLSPDGKSKFRWIGVTFLLSAVGGFLVFHVFQFIVIIVLKMIIENSSGTIAMIYPLLERVVILFVTRNGELQTLFSFATGVFGVVCFASSFTFKKGLADKPQPKQKKKTT